MKTGLKTTKSEALSQPIKAANKKETRRKEPSLNASNAELGNKDKINAFISIFVISEGRSTVIGMRGNLIIKIEIIPTTARSKVDIIIIEKVQADVFIKTFEFRNLFIETMAVEKTIGTTIYRPKRTNNSVKNAKTEDACALSKGNKIAVITPIAIPIKYFIQTFINKIITYYGMQFHSML